MLETAKKQTSVQAESALMPSGPGMAVLLSGALGVFVTGLATFLAASSGTIKEALNWWDPGGPLTGKTGVGVIAWLVCWAILHAAWGGKEVGFSRVWVMSLALIVLGMILMFPPVFELVESHK